MHEKWISRFAFFVLPLASVSDCFADLPNPVLNTVFPAGAKAGDSVDVEIAGSNLDEVSALYCGDARFQIEQHEQNKNRFTIRVPKETPLGFYDLRAVCRNGMSSPRSFFIGNRQELLEGESNETNSSAQIVPLDVTINGRLGKKGDLDHFRFAAEKGQRVVIECWADRIDSRLRAVLEVLDDQGRRMASNRGYFGIDPLIDFHVPADGSYVVKLYDLIHAGSAEHYYRLDIDTGPRVAFACPAVVERGQSSRVMLYGWNLAGQDSSLPTDQRKTQARSLRHDQLDSIEVDIPAKVAKAIWPLPVRLQPRQMCIAGFPHYFPGGHAPTLISVTDVPVVSVVAVNHSAKSAQEISIPCEVSGQLVAGNEQDWFAIESRRGEVLYVEGIAQRINSPIDLDVRLFDSTGGRELAHFGDLVRNVGGTAFPTNHLDPAGRWVAPSDGRYLILARNLIGGQKADARRVYRLSVRREEPDFSLAVIPRNNDPSTLR